MQKQSNRFVRMLDYVSARFAAPEIRKDFPGQRERQQGGDAGGLV